ncbi:MAG TPA: hypothetical protein VGS61_03840 [Acidimicrobiales bacterium]|nr:hypothetical protein [Acidimicrobiales bacterium]
MTRRAVVLVAGAQASLVAALGLCVALDPRAVTGAHEGGVSNYGVHAATVAWYSLGFALDAALLAWAARGSRGPARSALALEAWLVGATLLSTYPYQHGEPWHGLHVAVGTALVVVQLALSAWLARGRALVAAAVVEVAGAIIAGVAILGPGHLLFVGQALATLGFAVVLVGGLARRASGAPPGAR